MRAVFDRLVRVFSSLGLSCALLMILGLLTWLGTLEQVNTGLHEVQKKYFESFFLVHRTEWFVIPLPGANLVLCLLCLNLIVGGLVRIRKGWATAGIMVAHVGIVFMLTAGFVKNYFSDDGHLTLFPQGQSNYFQSYYRHEIAITKDLGGGHLREYLVPQEDFDDAVGARTVTLTSPELPFELEVSRYMTNCRPTLKGPMFEVAVPVIDGVFLQEHPQMKQAEANLAGTYVSVVDKQDRSRQPGILWAVDSSPLTVTVAGEDWAIDLRKERYPMPFTLVLDKFTKEDHPRSNMPKAFSSDVTVIQGDTARPVRISMNEPLREQGLVVYQASWGPQNARPGDPLFSTLSVVRNPADQFPLYACIVIATGLVFHFSRKLIRYIRIEARTS